jgi:hypothetical protein
VADRLVALTYQAWDEFDHAIAGLTNAEATTRAHGGSAIAWTVAHAANTVDALVNRYFAGSRPNRLITQRRFATGGSGEADDWPAINAAAAAVQEVARRYLGTEPDLELRLPYDGSVSHLRQSGITLRYALMAVAAHYFLHSGEVRALRSLTGHPVPDYPDWGRDLVLNPSV